MASNNYYAYSNNNAQYGAYGTPVPTVYATQSTQQPGYNRAQGYESFHPGSAAPSSIPTQQSYPYAIQKSVSGYDTSKSYYSTPVETDTSYQSKYHQQPKKLYQHEQTSVQPDYSTTSHVKAITKPQQGYSYNSQQQQQPQHQQQQQQYGTGAVASQYTTNTSSYSSGASAAAVTTQSSLTGLDAAVYSAATLYYQQKQRSNDSSKKPWQRNVNQFKKRTLNPAQMHYCEVCKISCAGAQTYKEHLEGRPHKKKESQSKLKNIGPATAAAATRRDHSVMYCQLCEVQCTGADTYAAHIRGTKHQKVLNLYTRLGKPIPSDVPPDSPVTTIDTSSNTQAKKIVGSVPKIKFLAGKTLTSIKTNNDEADKAAAEQKATEEADEDAQPVGLEYIEDVAPDTGGPVSFFCKLCECKFTDPHAKIMHSKGRRHRLAYKKKVDPSIHVDMKTNPFMRKGASGKGRQDMRTQQSRRRQLETEWRLEWEQRLYEEELMHWRMLQQSAYDLPPMMDERPLPIFKPVVQDSYDDRHIMAKHKEVYPNEKELDSVQTIVSSCERCLKQISDSFTDNLPKTDDKSTEKTAAEQTTDEKNSAEPPRILKGVMRVADLAKGLLLHGCLDVQLIVICSDKPTKALLKRIIDKFPTELATFTEDKYEVRPMMAKSGLVVVRHVDPVSTCTITLTSPVIREQVITSTADGKMSVDDPESLNREICLKALAELRHAKWFQARASGLKYCVVILRVMKDFCRRVPTWSVLSPWALELLVEKVLNCGMDVNSVADGVLRLFETVASGLFLPDGPGLYDPCEKEQTDATGRMTRQQREDITASAQHAVRLIAFGEIYKVLGMEKLTPQSANSRKRVHTDNTEESMDVDADDSIATAKDESSVKKLIM